MNIYSMLPVSFLLHVKYTLSYRILTSNSGNAKTNCAYWTHNS